MVTTPPNYNTSAQTIDVDPDQLYHQAADVLKALTTDVGDSLSSITKTWEGLALSWFGDSAAEAQDFNDKWSKVMLRMFGPADPHAEVAPGEAVLPKIAGAVAGAAQNFGHAEDAVINMFTAFTAPGEAAAGSGRDLDTGPIAEHNVPKSPGN